MTEIVPAISMQCPDTTLAIVGPAPPRWLLSAARRHPSIRVPGRVPDVASWLDSADVVVCPLRIGGGVKVKMLEALARGCAIVTTPVGLQGLRQLPAGTLVECDGAAAVAEACVTLLTYADRCDRHRALARQAAAQLPTWDQAAEIMADGWTCLAGTGTRSVLPTGT